MPRSSKTRPNIAMAPSGLVLDLNDHLATRVAIFANRLSRAASRFYRRTYGIGVVEWRLMMYIGRTRETRANRICEATDLPLGTVKTNLHRARKELAEEMARLGWGPAETRSAPGS